MRIAASLPHSLGHPTALPSQARSARSSAPERSSHPTRAPRAQAAIETLLMMGVVLAFVIPLVVIFLSISNEKVSGLEQTQATALVQALSDTAGDTWYGGNGTRRMLLVQFPSNLRNLTLSGDLVGDERLASAGHEITLSYSPAGNQVRDLILVCPAPVRSVPPVDVAEARLAKRAYPTSPTLESGLVVLIFENKGDYVNIVRKVYGKVQ